MSTRKFAFTDLFVRNAKAGSARREIPDPGQANLFLVIQPSGKRGFAVRFRFKGKPCKLTLPSGIGLADARVLTTEAMLQVSKGINPIEAKKTEEDKKAEADASTLRAIAQTYLRLENEKLRSKKDREAIINRILDVLGNRPIAEIDRDEITAMLDKFEFERGPRAADISLAVLSRIFSWHETRTSKFRSPITRGMNRLKPQDRARTRALSDDEVRRVWIACDDERFGIFGAAVRFLLLTGARRNEVTRMQRAEIHGDMWTLPKDRSKPKIEVVRPLSRAAMAVLAGVPAIAGSEYVFTADGRRALGLDAKRKRLLDQISGVTGWRLHDLRRTVRTLLARLRIPMDIAEQCLGHRLAGGLIRATYDRHTYAEERREAFEKLAAEIERIVQPPPAGKVIALRR
jgi:integrase